MGTKHQAAPASLINSTIALVPVAIAIAAYEKSIRDAFSLETLFLGLLLGVNIAQCVFWSRLSFEKIMKAIFYLTVTLQWTLVAILTAKLEAVGSFTLISVMIVGGVPLLALGAIFLGAHKIGSSPIFSVLGLLAISTWGWSAVNDQSTEGRAHPRRDEISKIDNQTVVVNHLEPVKSLVGNTINKADSPEETWEYSGRNGPDYWSNIRSEYTACNSGKLQSPLDVPKKTPLFSEYLTMGFQSETISIFRDSKALNFKLAGKSKITYGSNKYSLKEIAFHTPSEHSVSGLRYPMEVQLLSYDATGHPLGLAVFVRKGKENLEFTQALKLAESPVVQNQSVKVEPTKFIPDSTGFWKYRGSITTPPCKEGVTWLVMKTPIELSATQIAAFRTMFPMNARPVQSTTGRSFEAPRQSLAH